MSEKLYLPKEVVNILGISGDLLRKWCEEFNIITEWTGTDYGKGHRRFTKENLETLNSIKKKIHEQGWSWDQVKQWRNGEEMTINDHVERSILEKKIDHLIEGQNQQIEFNRILSEKLELLTKELISTQKELSIANKEIAATKQQMIEVKTENKDLEAYIENSLKKRDKVLLENIRKTQETLKDNSAEQELNQNKQNFEELINTNLKELLKQRDEDLLNAFTHTQKELIKEQNQKKTLWQKLFSN
jgi:DNA-binding transcriptional MerR regulator